MAAPAPTARQTPAGRWLSHGHKTLITLGLDPAISFWEKPTKPPGVNGGDAIDVTNMHNDNWTTMAPRALMTLTEVTSTVAYDPAVYIDIVNIVNVIEEITVTWPNLDTIAFWGFLRIFEPTDHAVDGAQPEAQVTITPAMWDGLHPFYLDEEPVFTASAGTGSVS